MAITIIAQPNEYHPAYNPVVYQLSSNNSSVLSFRYIYDIWTASPTSTFLTRLRIAPEVNGTGKSDISKILQTQINQKLVFNNEVEDLTDIKIYQYEVRFGEEYSEFTSFTDYEFGGYWTRLPGTGIDSMFNIGDTVYIQLDDQTITDNRKILNGYHTVVDSGTNYIEIDVLYSSVGDGPATPGNCYFADRRKVIDTELETVDGKAYNEAVPFKDWVSWNESLILPTIWNTTFDNGSVDGKILTNAPNAVDVQFGYEPWNLYFGENKDKNRFTIKPYQNLYWNFMDSETDLVDSLLAYTDDGRRYLIPYIGATATMKQFDVSPTAPWINITPNTGEGGTPIDYSLVNNCKFYDVYPVRQRGFEACDAITIEFLENGSIVNTYTAYVSGQYNGRRKYEFTDVNGYRYEIRNVYNGPLNPNGSWYIVPLDPIPQIPTLTNNTTSGEAKGLRIDGVTLNNNADAYLAMDGNPTTFWESTGSLGQGILQYMFNDTFAIMQSYRVVSATSSGAPKDWTVQVSNDGVTWTLADTVTNNASLDVTRNAPYQAKYFRLRVTATQDGTNLKINTFQIFNQWSVAQMSSASECPTSGGFLIWQNNRTRPAGVTTYTYVTSTALTGADPRPTLQPHRIYLNNDCEINTTQLLFLDRAGSYSSFVFPLRVEEAGTNQKLSYKNEIGFIEDGQWTYNTYDSESTVYNSIVEKTYKLTTDWLNTSMSDYFEELITSPEVYIKLNSEVDNGRDGDGQPSPWLACTVLDSAFINPKQKNKRLINRTITVKLNSNNPINI